MIFPHKKRNKGKKELAPMHLRFLQFFTALRKRQFCSPVLYSLSLAFRHCFVRLFEAASAASSHSLAMFLYCDFKFIQNFLEETLNALMLDFFLLSKADLVYDITNNSEAIFSINCSPVQTSYFFIKKVAF